MNSQAGNQLYKPSSEANKFCKLEPPSGQQVGIALIGFLSFVIASVGLQTAANFSRPSTSTGVATVTLHGLQPSETSRISLSSIQPNSAATKNYSHPIAATNKFQILLPVDAKVQIDLSDALRQKLSAVEVAQPGSRDIRIDLSKSKGKNFSEQSSDGMTTIRCEQILLPSYVLIINQLAGWVGFSVVILLASSLLHRKAYCRIVAAALLSKASREPKKKFAWFIAGALVTAAGILFLEIRQPLFFVQDDNYIQFLPVILQGCKAVFNGEPPLYNPFQLLGAPTASIGTYALSYPFTYIAYAIASLLRDPISTIDVFAALHILAGYSIMYCVLAVLRVRGSLSACAAASFALSGFFLIAGRSWYYMLPVAVWAPVMVLAVDRHIKQRAGLGWLLLAPLAIGCFFHSGNAQMWFYAVLFCTITLALSFMIGMLPVKKLMWVFPVMLAGIGLAFPLLFWQSMETRNVWRHHDPGDISGLSLPHILLPFGNWTPTAIFQPFPYEICHFGVLFGAVAMLSLLLLFSRFTLFKADRGLFVSVLKNNIWLLPLALSLLLAWGSQGVVWDSVSWLPVFNKFTQSGKLIGFVTIFGIIVSAIFVERILLVLRARRNAEILIVSGSLIALLVHLVQCESSFYNFADAPRYSSLPAELEANCVIKNCDIGNAGRTLSIVPDRSRAEGYTDSLAHNFPTHYNVMSLSGMDLLVSTNDVTLKALEKCFNKSEDFARAFGIRWIVVHKTVASPSYGPVPWLWRYEHVDFFQTRLGKVLLPKCNKVVELQNVTLYRYPDALPLVFASSNPSLALPAKVSSRGIEVDVSNVERNDSVVLGFLARPWLLANLDGSPIALIEDQHQRIRVSLPVKGKNLSVNYAPPIVPVVVGTAILILSAIGIAVVMAKKSGF